MSKQNENWNRITEATTFAMYVAIKPVNDAEQIGALPFLVKGEDRKALIKQIEKIFKSEFDEFQKLLERKKSGEIREFTLSIPTWSALYLKEVLVSETYEDIKRIDYQNFSNSQRR